MHQLRLATWNVNSIKVRITHLLQWLEQTSQEKKPIDILGLQELKLTTEKFPYQELENAGYLAIALGQKTYNGVALIVRRAALTALTQDPETAFLQIQNNIPGFPDEQQRLLSATIHCQNMAPLRVICAYFPNGQAPGTEKFSYKLAWLKALKSYLHTQLEQHERVVLLGDFNIAPRDEDVHDPAAWIGQNLVSPEERAYFFEFAEMGLIDTFRQFTHPPKTFTWWDYRMMGFRRNAGVRIDHILINQALQGSCTACDVDKTPRTWEQPSDHAPVILTLNKVQAPQN